MGLQLVAEQTKRARIDTVINEDRCELQSIGADLA
jgi:hypothetical protein